MSVSELIREFSDREILPVEIDDVIAYLRARGVQDKIYYFWDADLDPEILSGHITHEDIPTNDEGDFERHATITYGKMGEEMERLVCCKELLHILDPDEYRVTRPEELNALIEKIVLPADLVDPVAENMHVLNDRIAITQATAVLFPLAARNLLMPGYTKGVLTLRHVADMAALPPRYVSIVMSDSWPAIHGILSRVS